MRPPEVVARGLIRHPGLFWRFGGEVAIARKDEFREEHVEDTCKRAKTAITAAAAHGGQYRLAFARRKAWLAARAECATIAIEGRLETGVGEPGVFECQVALHPVTGLPRLAGSGIKGLLAAWCLRQYDNLALKDPSAAEHGMPRTALTTLFGSRPGERLPQAGLLMVHDAWWDPASSRGPLELERSTSHHPEYYSGTPGAQASDLDRPNPVPRIAMAGRLHFAIDHADIGQPWAAQCLTWLRHALADTGAGAARTLGYGRFEAPPAPAGGLSQGR